MRLALINVTFATNFNTNQPLRYTETTEGLGKSFIFNLKVGKERCNAIPEDTNLVNGEKLQDP